MGRGPSFDREQVLRRAMEVFWRRGYQGASMAALGEAMGLLPGSIYGAFGSKEALFTEALALYASGVRAAAERAGVGPRALLEGWFAAHIAAALDVEEGALGRGCLLMASSMEAPRLDPAAAAFVRVELDELERLFRRCVRAARREAGVEGGPSATATARLLVAALAGISALSRAGAPRRTLEDVARAALGAV